MAYTKTTWVNNTPPAIDETNLNKIEQGIYDAHVLIDGAMLKSTYDPDEDGVIAVAQLDTELFLKDGSRAMTGDLTLPPDKIVEAGSFFSYNVNGDYAKLVCDANYGALLHFKAGGTTKYLAEFATYESDLEPLYLDGWFAVANLKLLGSIKVKTIEEYKPDDGIIIAGLMIKDGVAQEPATITFVIDGGGEVITTGQKGHLEVPYGCTIDRVTMLADQSGSIVVDIWKDTYANFPPTVEDTITASAKPTISSAQKSQDSTLSGWTKTVSAGDILAFNVDSCTTITRVTIALQVTKV